VCGFDRCKIVGHRDVVGIVGAVTDRPVVTPAICLARALNEADAILRLLSNCFKGARPNAGAAPRLSSANKARWTAHMIESRIEQNLLCQPDYASSFMKDRSPHSS
jgi:hypothetical protein